MNELKASWENAWRARVGGKVIAMLYIGMAAVGPVKGGVFPKDHFEAGTFLILSILSLVLLITPIIRTNHLWCQYHRIKGLEKRLFTRSHRIRLQCLGG